MIDVDVWVRGTAQAATRQIQAVNSDAGSWTEPDVRTLLTEMLLSLARAHDPDGAPPPITLRGFSWIVSQLDDGVLVHIEMPMGTASAGPFAIDEARLTEMIARVIGGPKESKLVH